MRVLLQYILALSAGLTFVSELKAELRDPPKIFEARVLKIQFLSGFRGKVRRAAANPRFVAEVCLLEDVEGLGLKGQTVFFAIGSPIRQLHFKYDATPPDTSIRLSLSSFGKGRGGYLRRVTKPAQQDAEPDL